MSQAFWNSLGIVVTGASFAANGDKDHLAVLLMSSPATHVD